MGVKHLSAAFEMEGFGDAMQRYVYLQLAYETDRKGLVRMNQTDLAERCMVSRATVARKVAELMDAGFIKRVGHGRYALILALTEAERQRRKVLDYILEAWGGQHERIVVQHDPKLPDPEEERMIRDGVRLGVLERTGRTERLDDGRVLTEYVVHWANADVNGAD